MVTKKITCFEGCKNKIHQGNGKRTESRENITDLPVQIGYQQSWEKREWKVSSNGEHEHWMRAKAFSMEISVKQRRTGKLKVLKTWDEFGCFNPHPNTKLEL